MLFGSELFEEYIGQLAMASMASLDIFTEGEQFDAKKLQEKMRVNHFTCFLITQLYWNNNFYLQECLRFSHWSLSANICLLQVVQKEREEKLVELLKNRLNQYVQGNKEDFVCHAEAEVAKLSNAGIDPCMFLF